MLKRVAICLALLLVTVPVPAFARRVEFGVLAGWTFGDGVSGDPILAGDGNIYDRIDPKDAFGWGLDFGVFVSEGAEVGFLYGNVPSTLEISGTTTRDVGDMGVSTYHGYFAYHWGASDGGVRPYVFGGLGATSYGQVDFTGAGGVARSIGGVTRFSTTWGAGVKFYPAPAFGVRFGVRMTPAYIKSDAEGWWCDPFWGCYVVGDAQYANLFDFSGGVTFRF